MAIGFNLAQPHRVVAANSHYYKTPTEVLYIDRVLPYHDLIYLVDGGWMSQKNGVDYPLEKGDVLLLAAGRHHYTRLPPCQKRAPFASTSPANRVTTKTKRGRLPFLPCCI